MNRELLKQKLHAKMDQKKTERMRPSANKLKKMKEEYGDLLKDTRITPNILELYKNALLKYPNNNVPKPNEILDNPDKYKTDYGKYVLEIIKKAQEKQLGVSAIKLLFNNEYTEYLTYLLKIPKVPDFLK